MASKTGISFTNWLPESRALTNTIIPSGSGVAAGDFDGDGRCDLFFCGLGGGSRLYRNLGNWRFQDATDEAGVACPALDSSGALFCDIDGDGDLDLLVSTYGAGTLIFVNDGRGHFSRAPKLLNLDRGGTSMAMAEADGDGRLDLYIANYRTSTIQDAPGTRFSMKMINNRPEVVSINGRPLTDPEWTNRFKMKTEIDEQGRGRFMREELGEPDLFCKNMGNGRFEPVPWTSGRFLDEDGKPLTGPPLDWGLSVAFRDFNGDGAPDIYVCNDFGSPDRFWLNDRHGHFRAAPRSALREISFSSMGVDVADLDRDGLFDFMVVEMLSRNHQHRLTQRNSTRSESFSISPDRPQYPRNTLFVNRGDGSYAEIAQYAAVDASDWSWMPIFLDVDLDGYEDLLIPNGFIRDNMNMDVQNRIKQLNAGKKVLSVEELSQRKLFPALATPNLAFRNLGNFRFQDLSHEWGFDTPGISQGACLADLDNDGDLDVVVNNMNEAAGLYRNNSSASRLAVRLRGRSANSHGIGARITVTGGPVQQSQEITCGGRYLSCDEAMRVFAVGPETAKKLRIEVNWPTGRRSVVREVAANYVYEIDEAGAEAATPPAPVPPAPYFEDASGLLNHTHHEELFDDFARQPTFGKRLSQLGPGVCWCDLNGDGHEDLVITSGKGGSLGVFINNGKGGFQPRADGKAVTRDQTAVVAWPRNTNSPVLLVGAANYEDGQTTGASVLIYDAAVGKMADAVPEADVSVGPLALGDLHGDGNLDLFVGGRLKAGKYPEPVNSRMFRNQGGTFVPDETNSKVFEALGMVSSAVFSDLDGDGFPELILACEWGPLRVFHNDQGALRDWNLPVTLSGSSNNVSHLIGPPPKTLKQLTGWWNGVTTGDLDGDGRLDIVASNWGENSKYNSHRAAPLRLYFADFNQEGPLGLLESYFEPAMRKYVPEYRLDTVARGMPFLRGQFDSYQAFADAGVEEVLGEQLPQTRFLEAAWLESTVFLNRGDRWDVRVMPPVAQFAPAFAVVVADYDGDSREDVFLSQNFFAVEPETSKYDAGRGLWLKGDGHGGLSSVPGQESGVMVDGEQRGAAAADFDGDGRVDLVVTQNGDQTRLFRNVRAKPGLRVRLKGPSGNPWGIGSQIRLKYGDRLGPVREVHCGSGYWSVDSPVSVLGYAEPPQQLWVRWPGGKSFAADLPAGAAEVEVSLDGNLTRRK